MFRVARRAECTASIRARRCGAWPEWASICQLGSDNTVPGVGARTLAVRGAERRANEGCRIRPLPDTMPPVMIGPTTIAIGSTSLPPIGPPPMLNSNKDGSSEANAVTKRSRSATNSRAAATAAPAILTLPIFAVELPDGRRLAVIRSGSKVANYVSIFENGATISSRFGKFFRTVGGAPAGGTRHQSPARCR